MRSTPVLAPLRALCSLGLHADVLVPAVLEALHDIVPSHRNLFDWTDAQGRLLRYCIEGPLDTTVAQHYFDEFHNRREAEVMPRFDTLRATPAGVRSAQELQHADFFRSALYNEIWRPQGLHTRLEAVVRTARGRLLGSLVLYRGPGEPDFIAEDEERLAAVLPWVAAGMEAGEAAVQADRHVPAPEPAETLLLTLDGQLCHASAGAHRLLLMADGGASRAALSRPLDALAGHLLPRLLACVARREAAADTLLPPPSLTQTNASGQFVASAVLLQPLGAREPPLVQVTLRRHEPHGVALERALRGLPLTPGQVAVCRELYHGRSHAHIGQRLGVAPATVVDHVRKIYRALELRSTLELRGVLDRAIAR